jgi:uncharacterized glyoxalase superfamily protein PhnB
MPTRKKPSPSRTRKPKLRDSGRRAKSRSAAPKSSRKAGAAARPQQKARRTPETLRLRSFAPSLTVDDLDVSIKFYTDVLGFIVTDTWTSDDGKRLGVMLKAGLCELGLSQDDWGKGRDRKKGLGVRLWCKTEQDVDALAARIKDAGGTVEAPKDEWGSRSINLDDPDGYHLSIFKESDSKS